MHIELPANTLLAGNKYRIERMLGKGGFGITYLGTQTLLNRKVAIKEFFMSDFCSRDNSSSLVTMSSDVNTEKVNTYRKKFLKEARTIAALNHPHIVKVIDVFEENGTAYYAMEYISDTSVQDYMKEHGPLSEAQALSIIRQVGEALSFIHSQKFLHLDVKPSNIMLRSMDDAVLIDFGISKHYTDTGSQTSTSTSGISRGYAPMEQYKEGGVASFTPATDVYSLGATLYAMLIGKRPPEAQDVFQNGLPPMPSTISASTIEAVLAAMRPAKVDRPQSVDQFLLMLEGTVKPAGGGATNMRSIIEGHEAVGEYKEAYNLCLECIRKGNDVEYAQEKCKTLIPLMRKKNKSHGRWMYVWAVVITIAGLILSIIIGINQ